MHGTVIFDVRSAGYQSGHFLWFGLALFLPWALVWGVCRHLSARRKEAGERDVFLPLRWLSAASTLIGLAWITLVASMTYPPYHRLRQALERGRCAVLEGAIADFHPGGTSGRSTTESFTVSGVPFSYSAFEMSPGFNQTAAVNGPLHEGLRVRIHAYQGAIARLEIFEERTAR